MTSIKFYEPSPAWRWHGLGMLQREISDEMRIHVWHPALVRVPPGLRRVHDHRFELSSLVLIGSLVDHAYDVFIGAPDANTKIWRIRHDRTKLATTTAGGIAGQEGTCDGQHDPRWACFDDLCRYRNDAGVRVGVVHVSATLKSGTQPTAEGDEPDVDLIGPALAMSAKSTRRFAGDLYTIACGDFHQSEPTELAVTLVRRKNFAPGVSARVLGDHAHSAVAGQHAPIERDDTIVERVLAEAREVLGRASARVTGGRW